MSNQIGHMIEFLPTGLTDTFVDSQVNIQVRL